MVGGLLWNVTCKSLRRGILVDTLKEILCMGPHLLPHYEKYTVKPVRLDDGSLKGKIPQPISSLSIFYCTSVHTYDVITIFSVSDFCWVYGLVFPN